MAVRGLLSPAESLVVEEPEEVVLLREREEAIVRERENTAWLLREQRAQETFRAEQEKASKLEQKRSLKKVFALNAVFERAGKTSQPLGRSLDTHHELGGSGGRGAVTEAALGNHHARS